jgi:GAF domain-containing protein
VISQSPTDVQPVFDTIADAALNLCKAANAIVFTFDGELIHLAAIASNAPEGADAMRKVIPRPPSRETAAARAVLTRSLVVIPDVMEDPEFRIGFTAAATGFRSIVSIPLMREGNPIGVLGVGRSEPGPFPDKQIELLKTFADQAVIAIENSVCSTKRSALARQTATADASVISRSLPTAPVRRIVATAAVFCRDNAACDPGRSDPRRRGHSAWPPRHPETAVCIDPAANFPPGPSCDVVQIRRRRWISRGKAHVE